MLWHWVLLLSVTYALLQDIAFHFPLSNFLLYTHMYTHISATLSADILYSPQWANFAGPTLSLKNKTPSGNLGVTPDLVTSFFSTQMVSFQQYTHPYELYR